MARAAIATANPATRPEPWRLAIAALAAVLCIAGSTAAESGAEKAANAPISIAVFDFELEDFTAAGRSEPSAVDAKSLAQATQEARQKLAQSGRYAIVDTSGADLAAAQGHGLRNCRGCDAAIAAKLGADEVLVGVITKISMTEYTVTVQVTDVAKGAVIGSFSTGLRIGAGYSWARGVAWLMKNRILKQP